MKILNSTISLILAISLLLTMQLTVFAQIQIDENSVIIAGKTYTVTESINPKGLRQLTYESDCRKLLVTYYHDKIVIVSPEGTYSYPLNNNNSEYISTNLSQSNELQPLAANACLVSSAMAFGFTGKTFTYSRYNTGKVELHSGLLSKVKYENNYNAVRFYNELVTMNRIYSSMNDLQRNAWVAIRVAGIIPTGGLNMLDVILIVLDAAGIDLGSLLEATVLGLSDWYEAEQRAEGYFSNY